MDSSGQSVHIARVAKERPQVAVDDAPFRDVNHALNFAYRLEDTAVIKVSSALADLRAGELRGAPLYDTPWDRHAQAALILRMVRRNKYKNIIEAHYRRPNTTANANQKYLDCEIVANNYIDTRSQFAVYCVYDWANIRLPSGWVKYFVQHSDCSKRTLYRQRKTIYDTLDQLETQAINDLSITMHDAGLIE